MSRDSQMTTTAWLGIVGTACSLILGFAMFLRGNYYEQIATTAQRDHTEIAVLNEHIRSIDSRLAEIEKILDLVNKSRSQTSGKALGLAQE